MAAPPLLRISVALLLAVLGAAVGGCGSSHHATARTTVPTTVARPKPRPRATPTTVVPSDPQTSADAAATVFMEGWISADRGQSESVAVPVAVNTLFARAYAGQPLNDRGCSDFSTPIVCTWGPYGGANPDSAVYEVSVVPHKNLWFVSSVEILS